MIGRDRAAEASGERSGLAMSLPAGITSIGPSLGIAAGFHLPPHLVSIHPGPLLATCTGMPVRIGLLKWPFAE